MQFNKDPNRLLPFQALPTPVCVMPPPGEELLVLALSCRNEEKPILHVADVFLLSASIQHIKVRIMLASGLIKMPSSQVGTVSSRTYRCAKRSSTRAKYVRIPCF